MSQLQSIKLGILGTGNMAEALISGLGKSKNIVGYDVDSKRLNLMSKKYRITKATSIQNLVKKSEIILLAVKPQQMDNLLKSIQPHLKQNQLMLSIAAGLRVKFYENRLGKDYKIIRLMPNTPVLVKLGATAFYANKKVNRKDKKRAKKIFEAVGEVFEVKKEELLDGVTGLSGSGPAFVYLFIDSLIKGGVGSGLNPNTARGLAIQTLLGATTLFKQSNLTAEELIKKVASKGGTTEAGLKFLNQKKFGAIVQECVKRAKQRAKELT